MDYNIICPYVEGVRFFVFNRREQDRKQFVYTQTIHLASGTELGCILPKFPNEQIALKTLSQLSDLPIVHLHAAKSCNITAACLNVIASMDSLKCVDLTDNWRLKTQDFLSLEGHSSLEQIYISSDECDDMVFQHFSKIPSLNVVSCVWSQKIIGSGLQYLIDQKIALLGLSLRGCRYITDENIAFIQYFTKLRWLDIRNCVKITDRVLEVLKKIPQLEEVHWDATKVDAS